MSATPIPGNTNNTTTYSYYTDPAYSGINYTRPISVYYLIFGFTSAVGNLFLILLFIKYSKLRATQLGMHNGFLQKVAKFCKKGGI